jgi:hypothetical protein
MLKKALLIVVAVAFMCVPALAGDRPEYDGVGQDVDNIFNGPVKVIVNNENPWNLDSDWLPFPNLPFVANEFFDPPSALVFHDVCFGPDYPSALTRRGQAKSYVYRIVLQMDPQTDLDINIRDCVVKYNSFTAFGDSANEGAAQTGRTEDEWGFPLWDASRNPRVTATAYPGPFAVNGFVEPFYMTSRTQGALVDIPLVNLLYSSKGLWEEGLLVRMPMDLRQAPPGGPGFSPVEWTLTAGDMIEVRIDIPRTNPTDIRYGEDNVVIKYVAIAGTEITP